MKEDKTNFFGFILLISISLGVLGFVYYKCAVINPGAADLFSYNSLVLDADSGRVLDDWTNLDRRCYRATVHPFYQIFAYPPVKLINHIFFEGKNNINAVRVFCILLVLFQALATGLISQRLLNDQKWAFLAGFWLFGVSASAIHFAGIPESSCLAGIPLLLSVIYFLDRKQKNFAWSEIPVWCSLGILSFGSTVTQIIPWGIVLGFRLFSLREITGRIITARILMKLFVILGLLLSFIVVLALSQNYMNPANAFSLNPLNKAYGEERY